MLCAACVLRRAACVRDRALTTGLRRYGLAAWDVLGRAKEFVRRDSLWTEKLDQPFLRATGLRWTGPGVFFLLLHADLTESGKMASFTDARMGQRMEYTSEPVDFMDSFAAPLLFFYKPHLEAFLDLPRMEAEQSRRARTSAPVLQAFARRGVVRAAMRAKIFRVEGPEKTRLASGETRVAHYAPAEQFYAKMRKMYHGPRKSQVSSVTPALQRVWAGTGKYVVARECDHLARTYENRGPEPWEARGPSRECEAL